MRTLTLSLMLLSAILPAAPARAVDVPAPDRIGIYFDAEATSQVAWFGPLAPVTMYITLTNPTFENIYGWQAAVRGVDPASLHILGTTITGGLAIAGPELQFDIALEEPLSAQPTTVLATISGIMWLGGPMVCLTLTGVDSPAIPDLLPLIWMEQAQPSPIRVAHYYLAGVTAGINESPIPEGPNCVSGLAVEGTTWGALKAMHR